MSPIGTDYGDGPWVEPPLNPCTGCGRLVGEVSTWFYPAGPRCVTCGPESKQ